MASTDHGAGDDCTQQMIIEKGKMEYKYIRDLGKGCRQWMSGSMD